MQTGSLLSEAQLDSCASCAAGADAAGGIDEGGGAVDFQAQRQSVP